MASADAVGVDDPLVDPADRPSGCLLEVELAGRQHDLALDAVDRVAVRVDVGEVVVLADGLELVERVAERPVVPQPGVAEGVGLVVDLGLRSGPASPLERSSRPSRRGRRPGGSSRCCCRCTRSSWAYWFGSTVKRWIASG